jgi:nicotinamidase/pyrazinamidase
MKLKKALLIVDVQNDFCPGGALDVPQGDKIIPRINKYIKIFSKNKLPIFASRDWHPKETVHFKKFGGVWPVHCVRNTKGAAFHPKLKLPLGAILLYKGMDPDKDSYSVFQAKDASRKDFIELLKTLSIQELYVAGLATDYCVKYSAMDAINKGFKVKILIDAIKGVNLKPNDSKETLDFLTKVGAKKLTLKHVEDELCS